MLEGSFVRSGSDFCFWKELAELFVLLFFEELLYVWFESRVLLLGTPLVKPEAVGDPCCVSLSDWSCIMVLLPLLRSLIPGVKFEC